MRARTAVLLHVLPVAALGELELVPGLPLRYESALKPCFELHLASHHQLALARALPSRRVRCRPRAFNGLARLSAIGRYVNGFAVEFWTVSYAGLLSFGGDGLGDLRLQGRPAALVCEGALAELLRAQCISLTASSKVCGGGGHHGSSG